MQTPAPRAAVEKTTASPVGRGVAMVDNRAVAVAQRQMQAAIDTSPRQVAQRQQAEVAAPRKNTTGLPDNLKAGVENLSGYSLDDVKVHYNSAKPGQLQAHAYAQGTDIHVAPGQEQHLPHEAWHVVQQKQGRVKATVQMKGIAINDNSGLEREADYLGKRISTFTPIINTSMQPMMQSTIDKKITQRVYDVKQFNSWEEHANWLISKSIKIPSDILVAIIDLSLVIEKQIQGAKAVYLSDHQEGLTQIGESYVEQAERGAIILDSSYVNDISALPKDERVAAFISTIRHELQHAENLDSGLISEEPTEGQVDLDEVIAHSENILNKQLGGEKVEAPLWDQVDHLMQAEDYWAKSINEPDSPLKQKASRSLEKARRKVNKALRKYGDPDKIIANYLDSDDFSLQDFQVTEHNKLAQKSEAMDKAIKK